MVPARIPDLEEEMVVRFQSEPVTINKTTGTKFNEIIIVKSDLVNQKILKKEMY